MGKAYIIGTGPGDEGLLTVNAVNTLKKCTAVLYDRLVSNNVLNYLKEDCEIYYCGKEPGAHYKTQEEINDMIVHLAKQGHIVGRIKGGDPYVFGRGGEEVLALRSSDIPFEVIPGVTSPIAVLNYAGIPITHRGIAQSFHVVTGMSAKNLNVNFEALSKENGTLVFMMGLSRISLIVSELVKNGKDIDTPAAVVMRGTSSKQKKVIGTLRDIEDKVIDAGLESPCIIVVGDVVNLSNDLSWYENKPLFGYNICITRSKNQSKNLREKLYELGAEVTEINSIKIKQTSDNLDRVKDVLSDYDHIILTSVNAVNIFFDYLISKNIDIRLIKGKFSVIGQATGRALAKRGIQSFIESKEFKSEGLIKELIPQVKKGEKALIPGSSEGRILIYDKLIEAGVKVDKINIYDTVSGKLLNQNCFKDIDLILFTSPSTVRNMISMAGLSNVKEKKCIAIGPETLKALKENGISGIMCSKHSEEGFLEEIENLIVKAGI